MKRFALFAELFFSLLFEEFAFRYLQGTGLFEKDLFVLISFCLLTAVILFLFLQLFSEKGRSILLRILLVISAVFFSVQLCMHSLFGFFVEWHSFSGFDQITGFTGETSRLILKNLPGILLLFVPFFVSLFIRYARERIGKKDVLIVIALFLVSLGSMGSSLLLSGFFIDPDVYRNAETAVRRTGVYGHLYTDSLYRVLPEKEKEIVVEEPEPEPEDIPVEYGYNELDIDFERLIENDEDSALKQLDEYFSGIRGTRKNEYTGLFEGKNLIYIMAESFNEIAVSKDLTPTLYKLVNDGFYFSNYYSPTIYSTIGGECMELTGLFFSPGMLGIWKKGTNDFPMGIATMFKNEGYATYAYHNSDYTFQDRDKYLKALGFSNFTGCGNGLEEKIGCKWVASDVDLIDATFDDYAGKGKFMVYYATVSGHGEYWPDHAQAKKHYAIVDEYYGNSISSTAKSYVATQIELDLAMESLLKKLEDRGLLEDTVIVLAADHHPYFLDLQYINELSDYKRDSSVESQSSNLIIYNPSVEHTVVEKVCCTPDVLPTVYNLFGLDFDSRLFTGRDIFSEEPGLCIFDDDSWVTDDGCFNAYYGTYTSYGEEELTKDYTSATWQKTRNRLNLSLMIFEKNYYAHVFRR